MLTVGQENFKKKYMKQRSLLFAGFIFLMMVSTFFQSCLEDKCDAERTFVQYTPVYLKPEAFRIDIQKESSRPLKEPGKIYVYNNYLLINEIREGIHVFDNSNPQNPVSLGFIAIPGNVDMAINNGYLYADSYVDLLTIDLNDINDPKLVDRQEDVFYLFGTQSELGYLVYYNETDVTLKVDCNDVRFNQNWFWERGDVFLATDNAAGSSASGSGIGGSMARFTISSDHLYTVDQSMLKSWKLSNTGLPVNVDSELMGWNIETIFPYEDMLFVGSTSGMYIYSISTPSNPSYASFFGHANACDPVVVENDIAFITLRDGTRCETFSNQLDVVDISDPLNPNFIKSYPMDHPHGLAVRNDILYLCEGDYGFKVFDVADLEKIDKNLLSKHKDLNGYDVISLDNDVLLLIGTTGFYQYNSQDPKNLKLLSHIPVEE